jgi:hypothetical protein
MTSRAPHAVRPHVAECHRRESREACRPHRGCTLGDHTITGRSNRRVLSLSRRLLLGVGPESQTRRNNSEHGNQKQRRDRASHGTPPSTQRMDGTIEGAARHGSCSSSSAPMASSIPASRHCPKPPSGQWHRNLLLALRFPKFGEPRQSSIPFGKIENDALGMRISFEAGGSGRFTHPTERMTGAFRQNATHRWERLRLTRTPLYSWRSRAAASTERRAGRKAKHSIQGSLHKGHRAPRSRPSREWAGGQSQPSPQCQRPRPPPEGSELFSWVLVQVEPDANISPRKRFLVIPSYWRFFRYYPGCAG